MWYHDNTFDGVYAHYRRPIWQYILERTRNKEVAEELTQDVFLKAYRERESFNPNFKFSGWLWAIAKNTVTDWHRRNRQIVRHTQELEPSKFNEIPSPDRGPEDRLQSKSYAYALMREVAVLPSTQRRAFTLRILYRFPYREIARCLNISVSAAKRLIQRARVFLLRGKDA